MSDLVTIVIDDTTLLDGSPDQINIDDTGGWFTTTSDAVDSGFPSNYNNTNFIPDFTPFGKGAWLFAFDGQDVMPYCRCISSFLSLHLVGIAVSLFGVTPPTQFNQTFGIGDSSIPKVNITDPRNYTLIRYSSPSQGGEFYTSRTLSDPGSIKVGITGSRGLAIDYALVTVGPSTDLQGQTILVDDSSSEIVWHGNWTVKSNYTLPVPCFLPISPQSDDSSPDFTANMRPHGNSSHYSSNVGDSFTFEFAGE